MQTDAGAWDARARELSGSSNALCIAFAARLAHRMGRVQPGGNAVTVVLPVSGRTAEDDRANALSSIIIAVDSE
jgi:molybdopterin synthase catalytic subunit